MYPRNSATPPTIDLGEVIQKSDGAQQTSGVSARVKIGDGSWGPAAGSLNFDADSGIWTYAPTQAETNATYFIVAAYKTGCVSISKTVITTESSVAGQVVPSDNSITGSKVATNALNDKGNWLQPITAGRKINITAAGNTGINWASVENPGASNNFVGTNIFGVSSAYVEDWISLGPAEADISAIQNLITQLNNLSAKMNIYGAPLLEVPESGSTSYAFTVTVFDDEGKLVNLNALPTVTAANSAGTDRSANLSSVTNPQTGVYRFTYSVATTHPKESLRIVASGNYTNIVTEARYIEWIGAVVDYDTVTTLQDVQSRAINIQSRLPTALLGGRMDSSVGNYQSGMTPLQPLVPGRQINVASAGGVIVQADSFGNNLVIPNLATQASVDDLPTLPEIEASTVLAKEASLTQMKGATFDTLTDSLESIRNRGDAAWTTGGGGGPGGDIIITPEAFLNLDTELLAKNVFIHFNGESRTYTITLATGTFDGQPMRFVLNNDQGVTVFSQNGITSSTNTAVVNFTPLATLPEKCGTWSLRRMSDGFVYLSGPAVQRTAAVFNPPPP